MKLAVLQGDRCSEVSLYASVHLSVCVCPGEHVALEMWGLTTFPGDLAGWWSPIRVVCFNALFSITVTQTHTHTHTHSQ